MLKANQDAFVVRKEVAGEPDSVFFGVFDGHGSSGTDCAQFARDKVCGSPLAGSSRVQDRVKVML